MAAALRLVQVKHAPPYTPEQQHHVYLNPMARAAFNPATGARALFIPRAWFLPRPPWLTPPQHLTD
jgi:hypothetical protein